MNARAKTVAEGWVPITHGIQSSYNRGCRCNECRKAFTCAPARRKAVENGKQRERDRRVEVNGRMVHPSPWGGHGSVTAYFSCYCRCDSCRAAAAAYRRRERS